MNGVDAHLDGTADFLRTFDDYSGSPTQHMNAGWDNVTGLGTPNASFLTLIGRNAASGPIPAASISARPALSCRPEVWSIDDQQPLSRPRPVATQRRRRPG